MSTPAVPSRPSDEVLAGLGARVLDPTTDLIIGGRPPVLPTAYITDRLVVQRSREDTSRIAGQAEELGWTMKAVPTEARPIDDKVGPYENADGPILTVGEPSFEVYQLAVAEGRLAPAPDAWVLLQRLRAADDGKGVSLDHLVQPETPVWITNPFGPDTPVWITNSVLPYMQAGTGGHQVVSYVGPAPARRENDEEICGRRPVVAIVDSGVYRKHPWLKKGVTEPSLVAAFLGGESDPTNPEYHPSQVRALTGERDRYAGHGTFIAGLIRQTCPDADIVSFRVVPSEGAIAESQVAHVLEGIADLVEAYHAGAGGLAIDVLSLSIGYYHETGGKDADDAAIVGPLRRLAEHGVLVVCSAGNDAATRPRMPGCLSTEAWPDATRVLAVGALNASGRTDALFTNTGDWVTHYRVGASLFSTLPLVDSGAQAAFAAPFGSPQRRRTAHDPDDARGGFGVWSGTSFSAPVLAGQLAQELVDNIPKGPEAPGDMRARALAALAAAEKKEAARVAQSELDAQDAI